MGSADLGDWTSRVGVDGCMTVKSLRMVVSSTDTRWRGGLAASCNGKKWLQEAETATDTVRRMPGQRLVSSLSAMFKQARKPVR